MLKDINYGKSKISTAYQDSASLMVGENGTKNQSMITQELYAQ